MADDQSIHRMPCMLVWIAWLVVCIPAGWGISQTVMRSMELFKAPQTSADDLHSKIGQTVHLEGTFAGPGKQADFLLVGKDEIYLMQIDSGGVDVPYQSSVAVDGLLQFHKFPAATQPDNRASQMQIAPDYFFIQNAKVRILHPPTTSRG